MEISDDNSPPLYTPNVSTNNFDGIMMKQALVGMRTIRTMALHSEVRGKDGASKEGDIPWNTLILGMLPKTPMHSDEGKKNSSANFLQISSSVFYETGNPKREGEELEETLTPVIGEKRKRRYLRNLEYEGRNADKPSLGDHPSLAADPRGRGDAADQHVMDLPRGEGGTSSQDVKMGSFVGGNPLCKLSTNVPYFSFLYLNRNLCTDFVLVL